MAQQVNASLEVSGQVNTTIGVFNKRTPLSARLWPGAKPADHAALALETALWSAYYNCFHGASKLLTETSEVLRVDLPALEKTVKDERKQFWKEKQAKAKERAKN